MRLSQVTKRALFSVIAFCLSVIAFAQTPVITGAVPTVISGTVSDNTNNNSLDGVTVSVKGTSASTTTNPKGVFTISVQPSAILVFSYVGYTRQEVKVGNTTNLDIKLIANTNTMDEVVVVGYGTKKRVNIQGAVSTIKASDIEDYQ